MHKPTVSIIVAMDEKRGIGKDNALMWRIPGELKRFKEITLGHPVIMGRKTFESIGRVLVGRKNIVITRNSGYSIEGAAVVPSLEAALETAFKEETKELFIIGGGQIFEQAMPLTNRLYLTLVKGDFAADVFFPDYSDFQQVISEQKMKTDEFEYKYLTVEK